MRFFKLFLVITAGLVSYFIVFRIEYICPRFQNQLGCYSENLEFRLKMFGLSNSRNYLKNLFDQGYLNQGQCHTLGHGLGQNAANSGVGMLEAMEDGSSFCGWAFFHGVMEGLFGSGAGHGKISVESAYDICNKMREPSHIEKFNCFHALGHGFYAVDSDVEKSLERCDVGEKLKENNFCYDGVFMAMTFGGNGTGAVTTDISVNNLCQKFSGSKLQYCLWRAVPIKVFLNELELPAPEYVHEISDKFLPSEGSIFWNGFGRELDSRFASNTSVIKDECSWSRENSVFCILGAAMHMVFYDKGNTERAIALCEELLSGEQKDECINTIKNSDYPAFDMVHR